MDAAEAVAKFKAALETAVAVEGHVVVSTEVAQVVLTLAERACPQ